MKCTCRAPKFFLHFFFPPGFSSRSSNFYDVYANSTINYPYFNETSNDYSNFNGIQAQSDPEYEYAEGEWVWVPKGQKPKGCDCDCDCSQCNTVKNDPFTSWFGSNAEDRQGILGLITPGTAVSDLWMIKD